MSLSTFTVDSEEAVETLGFAWGLCFQNGLCFRVVCYCSRSLLKETQTLIQKKAEV